MAANSKKDVAVRTPHQLAVIQNANEFVRSVFPEAGGDGISMIEDILNADLANLIGDTTGETTDIESLFGHLLRVDVAPKIAASTYESDDAIIPLFLIIQGQDLDTGTDFVTTTSGVTVMLKLAKVTQAHAFPCVIRITESKTNSGYDVQNCAILNVTDSNVVDA